MPEWAIVDERVPCRPSAASRPRLQEPLPNDDAGRSDRYDQFTRKRARSRTATSGQAVRVNPDDLWSVARRCLTSRRLRLELPLEVSLPIPSAMADCRTIPGFPSYCAGSLLMITFSTICCRCSWTGHHVFLRTRSDKRPNQVRLRYIPSTSYRFLQTPPLAGDALASQILFPMNRVRSLASSDWVCQLR